MKTDVTEAIIIAGGKGTRLMPLTVDKPKALVEIDNKPILQRQIEWLNSNGINHVIVCVGHMSNKIEKWVKKQKHLGVTLSKEDSPLGTGGAIKRAMMALREYRKPFVVLNCDDITNIDLQSMKKTFDDNKNYKLAILAVANPTLPYGDITINSDGLIESFNEKPKLVDKWVSCGVYIFHPDIKDELPDIGMVETFTFPRITAIVYKHGGKWLPITSAHDVAEFSKRWNV